MKVFISWSGDLSRQVAELLAGWLSSVLQGVQPWLSSADIEKGSIWFSEIAKEIESVGIGILCLTRDNLTAPWILFEAGALSKGLSKNRVCPLLIKLEHSAIQRPLADFNGTLP